MKKIKLILLIAFLILGVALLGKSFAWEGNFFSYINSNYVTLYDNNVVIKKLDIKKNGLTVQDMRKILQGKYYITNNDSIMIDDTQIVKTGYKINIGS